MHICRGHTIVELLAKQSRPCMVVQMIVFTGKYSGSVATTCHSDEPTPEQSTNPVQLHLCQERKSSKSADAHKHPPP